jgi:hypothetical protein
MMFKITPEKMRTQLLAQAERRLIEAEHAANHWKHEVAKAREEVERLSGRKVTECKIDMAAVRTFTASAAHIRNNNGTAKDFQEHFAETAKRAKP